MTDPNSRGLTNSGNATICNGSTHWSITGGHLRSPLPPSLPHTYSSISSFFTNSSSQAKANLPSALQSLPVWSRACIHSGILVFQDFPFEAQISPRERAADRRPFATAFASPINLKRLRTAGQLRHSVRHQILVSKTPKENAVVSRAWAKVKQYPLLGSAFRNNADKDGHDDYDDETECQLLGAGQCRQWAEWVCEEEIVRVLDTCDRPAQ